MTQRAMPDQSEAIAHLNELIQLDYDAIRTYDQAIENVDHVETRMELEMFRLDHERHVAELAAEVLALGGEPTRLARDFKGFVLEGFTAIRSRTGTEGALKAMRVNEQFTNGRYEKALSFSYPGRTSEIVSRGLSDERRHLRRIERLLADRVWESDTRHAV